MTLTVKHVTKTNAAADPLALVDGPTWDTDPHIATYTASYTGSVSRTLDSKLSDLVISASDFGVAADDTDNLARAQKAADAAVSSGLPLLFPPGTINISGQIDVSGALVVMGAGMRSTIIRSTSATAHAFYKNSASPILFRDLSIASTVTKSAGAGIYLTGNAEGDIVHNMYFTDQWRDIHAESCIAPHFYDIHHVNFINHAIHVLNSANPDAGDGVIGPNNIFSTSAGGTTVGIYHLSSGGWSVKGNKFYPGLSYGVFLDRDSAAATGILQITGNSFDTQSQSAIVIQATGTGTFEQIKLSGNIYSAQTNCVQVLGANANIALLLAVNEMCSYSANGFNLQAGAHVQIYKCVFNATVANAPAITTAATWPSSGTIDANNTYINTTAHVTLNGNTGVKVLTEQSFNLATPTGIPYYITSTTMGSSAALTAGNLLVAGSPPSSIANGQIPATATNDNAAAGKVGEVLSDSSSPGSVSVTTATDLNITTTGIVLTAGDWDLSGIAYFLAGGATTVTFVGASFSTTSATRDFTTSGAFSTLPLGNVVVGNSQYITLAISPYRVSVAGNTTYYFVGRSAFGVSTMAVGGIIRARRVR